MRKLLLTSMFQMVLIGLWAQNSVTANEYIIKFRDYAVIEMHRSGVPASITMAQGILESSNGNSRLASEGNNHFGIKCKSDWKGETIYADDDAPNECFRAYPSAMESYMDHSDFLRSNWRYQALFELQRTDYKGWAQGLRKAGYATNPKYGEILINLIERYQLHELDLLPLPGGELPKQNMVRNDIPAVYVEKGDDVKGIAERNGLRERHIYRYNDLEQGSEPMEGEIVYLKPKRRKGTVAYHTVQEGENMHQISQMHGVKIKHLYKKNRMEEGYDPVPGEKIYLQKKRDKEDEVEVQPSTPVTKPENTFVNPNSVQKLEVERVRDIERVIVDVPEYHEVVAGDNIYRIAERYHILEEDILRWNGVEAQELKIGSRLYLNEEAAAKHRSSKPTAPAKTTPVEQKNAYHVVAVGETVYRICKQYGITPEQLQEWNNLQGNNIFVGQKLRVK